MWLAISSSLVTTARRFQVELTILSILEFRTASQVCHQHSAGRVSQCYTILKTESFPNDKVKAIFSVFCVLHVTFANLQNGC